MLSVTLSSPPFEQTASSSPQLHGRASWQVDAAGALKHTTESHRHAPTVRTPTCTQSANLDRRKCPPNHAHHDRA